MSFALAFVETLPRDPRRALMALYWRLRGKRVRARNLLAHEAVVTRIRAHKADRFLAASPLAAITPIDQLIDLSRPIAIYVWEEGNFFFHDIAHYLPSFFARLGARASLFPDAAPPPGDHQLLVVTPHEFCVYGEGRNWPTEALDRAIYLNTEQWHTQWFGLAHAFLQRSRRALDINAASAAGLARQGIACALVPLLPLPESCFALPRAPLSPALTRLRHIEPLTWPDHFAERPYALAFLGVTTPRRARALARLAPVLARHTCFVHVPSTSGPIRPGDPDMIASADFAQIARNTRLLLNIHQGESHYLEWHRVVVSGIMQGCVVVTEPCLPVGLIRAGEHYLEASLDAMPALLTHLLETPEGQARLAQLHANGQALRARLLAAADDPAALAALTRFDG